MGASLRAVTTSASAGDALGLFMVVWQTAVSASLGQGVRVRPSHLVKAADAAPDSGEAAGGDFWKGHRC